MTETIGGVFKLNSAFMTRTPARPRGFGFTFMRLSCQLPLHTANSLGHLNQIMLLHSLGEFGAMCMF